MKIPAEPKPEWIQVAVDTREQRPVDVSPMQIIRTSLVTGDYGLIAMPKLAALERKELSDLCSVVGRDRDRFEREIDRLLAFPVRGIFVESTWDAVADGDYRGEVSPSAVTASLLGWAARGVPVFMCGSHERCGKFISRVLYLAARRRWRESRQLLAVLEETHDE